MSTVAVSTGGATAQVPRAQDWVLTAPWWHWLRQGDVPPDQTRPALQKYATPGFTKEFCEDPQRRLVFDATADRTAPPPYDAKTGTVVTYPTGTTVTKLYLPTHHRHYLVAVELHCARPGLPTPDRTRVCEAGFVVRRRRADVPPELAAEARTLQRAILKAAGQLRAVQRRLSVAGGRGRIGAASLTALAEQHGRAEQKLAGARQALTDWAEASGLERRLEGWVGLGVDTGGEVVPLPERADPGVRPLPGLGRWVPVSEVAPGLDEVTFPLSPLVPDPRVPDHDGTGRCVWFGTVPTLSSDLELDDDAHTDRAPRLDDLSLYEIRCVVRQHDPRCPRQEGARDCRGPLTWSEPSEAFRLAGALDARGTAHRPTTIRLPGKAELAEGVGVAGGVRVQQSNDYNLEDAGFQICSFSIPLITIVATFVLRIFLPIVVFLLGLWVLLALKLCIPPSLSVSGGLQADLDAQAPDADIDADFGAEIDSALLGAFAKMLQSGSDGGIDKITAADALSHLGSDHTSRVSALRALLTTVLRSPSDDLRYEERVERAEVFGA